MINVTRDIIGDKMDDLQKEFIKQLERRTDEITDDPTVMLPDHLKQVPLPEDQMIQPLKVPPRFKDAAYLIIDKKTGDVVGSASSLKHAITSVNKRDKVYGAYRYMHMKNKGDSDG